jgi:hypothetical protein
LDLEKMKSFLKPLTKKTSISTKFDHISSTLKYIQYIHNTKPILDEDKFSNKEINQYFSFLNQNISQPTNIPLKNSLLWATHLLHPLDYSSFICDTKASKEWNWYLALTKDEKNIEMEELEDFGRGSENTIQILHFRNDLIRQIRLHNRVISQRIDHQFILNASERYEKFLLLKSENPNLNVVPTLDIDLVWHAHMLDHQSYVKDCMEKFGKIFNHKDDINDDTLKLNYQSTSDIWKKRFKEEYVAKKKKGEVYSNSSSGCVSCSYGTDVFHSNRRNHSLMESENSNSLESQNESIGYKTEDYEFSNSSDSGTSSCSSCSSCGD